MIDLKKFSLNLQDRLGNKDSDFNQNLIDLFVANEWFGITPLIVKGKVMVNPKDFEPFMNRIQLYFLNHNLPMTMKSECLHDMLCDKYLNTAINFQQFAQEMKLSSPTIYYILDFLVFYINNELCDMKDDDIENLLQFAFIHLSKYLGNVLTGFIRWLKDNKRTNYVNDYFMAKRYQLSTEAYDEEKYLQLMYYLFNEDYIADNKMYVSAAKSKNYVDTWLFLSLHFLCALRKTDLLRIPHPRLTISPDEIIQLVIDGDYADSDAKQVLLSITWRLNA